MKKKYMRCSVCGQIVELVKDTGVGLICCGEPMEEIFARTDDEVFAEKHVPTFKVEGNKVVVQVGSILHPSTNDHYIQWITLITTRGSQTKMLKPGDSPTVVFHIAPGESVLEIYEYCNIHSLWKTCVKDGKNKNQRELDME